MLSWTHEAWLWLLLPLAIFLLLPWGSWRKPKILPQPLLPFMVVKSQGQAWWNRAKIFGLFSLMILTLAQPQWGEQRPQGAQDLPSLVMAVDVSRSMAAEDITPNRLERVKAEIKNLLQSSPLPQKIGLMVFAGSAHWLLPPTDDVQALVNALQLAQLHQLPYRGSQWQKILEQLQGQLPAGSRLWIFSDGDFDLQSVQRPQNSTEFAIQLWVVATSQGGILQHQGRDLVYEGQKVVSRLDEVKLNLWAQQQNAQWQILSQDALINAMHTPVADEHSEKIWQWTPLYAVPLSMMMLWLLVSLHWRAAGLLLVLILPWPAGFAESDDFRQWMQQGYAASEQQDWLGCAEQYRQAYWIAAGESAKGQSLFNMGTCLHLAGLAKEAVQTLEAAEIFWPQSQALAQNLRLARAAWAKALNAMPGGGEGLALGDQPLDAQAKIPDVLNDFDQQQSPQTAKVSQTPQLETYRQALAKQRAQRALSWKAPDPQEAARVNRRLFELEVYQPAPLDDPLPLAGVRPW